MIFFMEKIKYLGHIIDKDGRRLWGEVCVKEAE